MLLKRTFLSVLLGLALFFAKSGFTADYASKSNQFKYERYDMNGGELLDDAVAVVFVSSDESVWAGTETGLSVYDGAKWTNRSFKLPGTFSTKTVARLLRGSSLFGPTHIAEGPQGTVWLGGSFGLWRVKNGHYEEISSSSAVADMYDLAVDNGGMLWIVHKASVFTFDGERWTRVLSPYIGKPASVEAPGLNSVVIATDGNVWIGGTVYGKPTAPWEHHGNIWVVDQERKKRGDGPPMAPLFEFDGKRWRAFGAPHGLDVGSAMPRVDTAGRIRVSAGSRKDFVLEGDKWKLVESSPLTHGNWWFLRRHAQRTTLMLRADNGIVEVIPRDPQTGEVLDLSREQVALLNLAEGADRNCVWLGTRHGLYKIWAEDSAQK